MNLISQLLIGSDKALPVVRASTHESGGTGRRSRNWLPFDSGPRREHLRLALMRSRSRDACRNNPIARAAVDRITSDYIGSGISPKPLITDEALRIAVIDAWENWSLECDADGQTDFYGLQTLALRSMLESGEVLALLESDLANGIPLKIRLLESDHLPFKNQSLPDGARIVDGIELDSRGKRVAYWLHPSHPADGDASFNEPVRVLADQVLHVFEATRPGQLRGVPRLATVLALLKDLDEFDDAQLLRQKISNLFAGFIRRPAADPASEQIGPDGQPLSEDYAEQPALEFEPGMLQELADGEEITFSTPPGTSKDYEPFMRTQMHRVSAALGIPYSVLTNDYRDVNDRVMRVALNEYKRQAYAFLRNVIVPKFCTPVRNAWVDAAILSGALPIQEADFKATRWTPHAWAYVHPVQEVQADVIAIRNRLKSRTEAVLERGFDAELVDREQADDLAREERLGLKPVDGA